MKTQHFMTQFFDNARILILNLLFQKSQHKKPIVMTAPAEILLDSTFLP